MAKIKNVFNKIRKNVTNSMTFYEKYNLYAYRIY